MRLSDQERQARRDAFRAMRPAQKAEYVLAYYKLPLALALIALVATVSVLHGILTRRAPVLYVGCVNVAPSDELNATLTSAYLDATGRDGRRSEVVCYRDLYLARAEDSADHPYSYASRLKLLATIEAEQLDVVVMDRDAWELLSADGYLLDLGSLDLSESLHDRLMTGEVVLADNALEVELGEADAYEARTAQAANALDLSDAPAFAGLSADVCLGIVANTPRIGEALSFAAYLESA